MALTAHLLIFVCSVGLCFSGASACIYLYGSRHEVAHYHYGYIGLDWPEHFATCTGTRQSPIHVPGRDAFPRVPSGEDSVFGFGTLASNGSNIKVVNTGHTVQVVLPSTYVPNATVVAKGDANAKLISKFTTSGTVQRVPISPAQFHFHTRSEHVIDGKEYPLEMHIVNWVYAPTLPGCGTGGCATVVGIMFELAQDPDTADKRNSFLDTIFSVMPMNEGSVFLAADKSLNFDQVLPVDRSYVTWEGSLTTPPCSEGILWHVLTTPVKITRDQLTKFQMAVGATECQDAAGAVRRLQTPSTGRQLWSTGASTTTTTTTSTSASTSTTGNSTVSFTSPGFVADATDGLLCRKLAGVNYRQLQDRQARPILFHAAPGVCDAQLKLLNARSKILGKLIFESNDTNSMTLRQYNDIVSAALTKNASCAGMTSAATSTRDAASVVLQMFLASVMLLWLL